MCARRIWVRQLGLVEGADDRPIGGSDHATSSASGRTNPSLWSPIRLTRPGARNQRSTSVTGASLSVVSRRTRSLSCGDGLQRLLPHRPRTLTASREPAASAPESASYSASAAAAGRGAPVPRDAARFLSRAGPPSGLSAPPEHDARRPRRVGQRAHRHPHDLRRGRSMILARAFVLLGRAHHAGRARRGGRRPAARSPRRLPGRKCRVRAHDLRRRVGGLGRLRRGRRGRHVPAEHHCRPTVPTRDGYRASVPPRHDRHNARAADDRHHVGSVAPRARSA